MKLGFKIVIWGLGVNGKNLIDAVGKEKVVAIIETNERKRAAKVYEEIPIVDYETYKKMYGKYCVVVTPMHYHDIEELLKKDGIRYFIQNKSAIMLDAFLAIRNGSLMKILQMDRNCKYYLGTVDLFGIYLYEYLGEMGADACFLTDENVELKWFIEQKVVKQYAVEVMEGKATYLIAANGDIKCTVTTTKYLSYELINSFLQNEWKLKLQKFKNCHKGRRVFIIATGPSMNATDLELLTQKNELSISMNRIYHIFDQTRWRPNYYVISDGDMLRHYAKMRDVQIALNGVIKFFSDNYLLYWEDCMDNNCYRFRQLQNADAIGFSEDIIKGVYSGRTVVYACLQLAIYMGFSEIYLLGCDYKFSPNFDSSNDHFYGKTEPMDGFVYSFDYDATYRAYCRAKKYADAHGIKIYNATRGGELEVFERVDFDSLFEEKEVNTDEH